MQRNGYFLSEEAEIESVLRRRLKPSSNILKQNKNRLLNYFIPQP